MIKIVICDDQKEEYFHLRKLLEAYGASNHIEMDIHYFSNGNELLCAQIYDTDLFFLDVEMPGLNGIDIAKEIRSQKLNCEIVFITNYIQYALQGYEVQAFRYLLKPIDEIKFIETANHLFDKIKKSSSYLHIKGRSGTQRILIKEIIYAETSQRHILIHTRDKVIDCYNTMEKLDEMLSEHGFFRCHQAYLISMDEISQIRGNDAVLKNETIIPISKNRKKEFKQVLTDFWGGKFL